MEFRWENVVCFPGDEALPKESHMKKRLINELNRRNDSNWIPLSEMLLPPSPIHRRSFIYYCMII